MIKTNSNREIRTIVAWVMGITTSVLIIGLLMIPPVIGLADSGDFGRVLGVTGLSVLNPQQTYEQLYFNYAHQQYGYGGYTLGGYVSTHVILVAVAGLIGRAVNGEVFDIRILGLTYSVFFVWAVTLLVRNAENRTLL
jgi:hypothetical protein